jgi:exopolysaccharide/PEP-CTERM locus tyrosine autokinase
VGFIDKALEKAKGVREKEPEPKSPSRSAEPAAISPFSTGARLTEQLIIPQEINYTVTRTVAVDPEVLRRNRIIAGGWEAGSTVVEEYKVLRTNILHRTSEENHNTLMVTGALPNEGKTLTAINLAIILSRELNHTVLLVDADLRAPSITHYFGLEDEPGMVDHLTTGVPISELLIHPQGLGRLVILPAGRAAAQAAELLNSPVMRDLVQELKHYYTNRYIIFDLPPLLVYADALAFAPLVDGIIVVAEAGKTPKESVQRCQEMLKKFKVLGFVFNKTGETSDSRHYRDYYYPQRSEPIVKKRFKLPLFK